MKNYTAALTASALALSLLVSTPASGAKDGAKKAVKPKKTAELVFVAPPGWKAVKTEKQEQVAMTEWVPADQAKETHSEMITLLAFAPSVDVSPKDWVENLKARFEAKDCKVEITPSTPDESSKSFALQPKLKKASVISSESIASYECASIAMSGMARAMMGSDGRLFVVQYAKKKSALTADDRKEMKTHLGETSTVAAPSDSKTYDREFNSKLKKTRTIYRLSF